MFGINFSINKKWMIAGNAVTGYIYNHNTTEWFDVIFDVFIRKNKKLSVDRFLDEVRTIKSHPNLSLKEPLCSLPSNPLTLKLLSFYYCL